MHFFIWQINARQDYLPREKLEKYLTINPSSSLSSLVPRGMSEDELTAELTLKFKTVSASIIFLYSKTNCDNSNDNEDVTNLRS